MPRAYNIVRIDPSTLTVCPAKKPHNGSPAYSPPRPAHRTSTRPTTFRKRKADDTLDDGTKGKKRKTVPSKLKKGESSEEDEDEEEDEEVEEEIENSRETLPSQIPSIEQVVLMSGGC